MFDAINRFDSTNIVIHYTKIINEISNLHCELTVGLQSLVDGRTVEVDESAVTSQTASTETLFPNKHTYTYS